MLSNEMKAFIQSISFNELFQAMDKDDRKIIIESIQDINKDLSEDDKKVLKDFLELMNKNKYSIIIGSIIKNNKHVLKSMLERAKETLPLEKFTNDDKKFLSALLKTSLFYSDTAQELINMLEEKHE